MRFAVVPCVLLCSLLIAPGCHKAANYQNFSDKAVNVENLRKAPTSPPGAPDAADPSASTHAPIKAPPPAVAQLAYTYDYTLTLPSEQIQPLMTRDQRVCVQAGPSVCQIISSSMNGSGGGGAINAELVLRATPDWLATFRTGLESEARSAKGQVTTANVQSEDLSASIIDTEAAVRAKTTLRDRIQKLLAERPGKLADVLAAETELARVQGELDATQSELAVMRTRVATSKLTLTYQAQNVIGQTPITYPLRQAVADFFGHVLMGFAFLLTVLSFVLPFVIVLAPIVWLVRLQRKKAGAGKVKPKATALTLGDEEKND